MNARHFRAVSFALLVAHVQTSWSASINPSSILVSHTTEDGRAEILEFSRTGQVLQSFFVPAAAGGGINRGIRDLEMDQYGKLHIFNGTFSPYLTTLTPQPAPGAATFQHHTIEGWSVVNNVAYGSVAIDQARSAVYVNDMSTAMGTATGIIQFDSNTFAATRRRGGEYTMLTFGQDGLLYAAYPATHPGNNMLDVIDPSSFSKIRTLTLSTYHAHGSGVTFTGYAVDAKGFIYGTEGREFGHGISKFSPDGTRIKFKSLGSLWFHDLAIAPDGTLVTLSQDGDVVITDTELNGHTTFQSDLIDSLDTNVAWAVATVPEPGTILLSVCAISLEGTRRRRYRPN